MEKIRKKDVESLFDIIGNYIGKYWIMVIIFLGIISILDIGISIAWNLSPDNVPVENEIAFYILHGVLLLVSLADILMVVLLHIGKVSKRGIALTYHIYAFVLMVWGTIVYIFDLTLGEPAIIYLMVATILAGLFVVEPIFFSIISALSITAIIIFFFVYQNEFFDGTLYWENVVNLAAFVFVIALLAYRNYSVTMREHRALRKLEELSYIDELTGLLNERSYVNETERLNKRIATGEDVKFAVVLMDVNNLKATNDAYGHRFGCSLVVRCGHTLPTLFKSSKAFHVGGDEFIVIVYGEDYDNFEETMKNFDEKMLYSTVQYDGVDLIFSVARGFSVRKEGQYYKDVLQIADKEMYANKKYLKEKYNMKGR